MITNALTLVHCFFCCAVSARDPREGEATKATGVEARILEVRLAAGDTLLNEIRSLPPDKSFLLCKEAFRIAESTPVSMLLRGRGFASVLQKDSVFDAQNYQQMPKTPRKARGANAYLFKLPSWKETGFGIYLYFRQQSPEAVDLSRDSKDVLVGAVSGSEVEFEVTLPPLIDEDD